MTEENGSPDENTSFDSALEEKRSTYPDEGFVLVEIDLMKPPGDALTPLYETLLLSEISVPPRTSMTDYVVYDADGHDYGHDSLEKSEEELASMDVKQLVSDIQQADIRTQRLRFCWLSMIAAERPSDCLDAVPAIASELGRDESDIQAAALDILVHVAEEFPEQVVPTADEIIHFVRSTAPSELQSRAVRLVKVIADHDAGAVVDAAPKLAALIQDDTDEENEALTALIRIAQEHPDVVVPFATELVAYVEEGENEERVGALAVLGMIAKEYPNIAKETIPTAVELLDAESIVVQANAAGLLADLANEYPEEVKACVPRIVEFLEFEDKHLRYNATSILARVAKNYPDAIDEAIDSLIDTLEDDFPFARANACWALGYAEVEQALSLLEKLEGSDPNPEVQEAARKSIQNIR